jgi:hypothetical protein
MKMTWFTATMLPAEPPTSPRAQPASSNIVQVAKRKRRPFTFTDHLELLSILRE